MNKRNPPPVVAAMAVALLCGTVLSTSAALLQTEFDPANFTSGQEIDNPYWPLLPGTTFVYASQTDDGCEVELFTVTTDTKSDFDGEYSSIVATVISDQEWFDPDCNGNYVLMEATFDWYAQDRSGNIWYFGEATTAWDDPAECPSPAGSWEAGVDDAEPGIVMLADPRVGVAYKQEFLAGEAEDRAKVLRLNASVSTAAGDYTDCLVTKEWSPVERGAIEHKYYCPQGGGLVLIEERNGKTARTELIGDTLPPGNYASVGVCPG